MNKCPCFGKVLRRLRHERGLSQEELAEKLDMSSHAHLCRLESGNKQPSLAMVFRIADALDIPAEEIVRLTDEERKREQTY